MTGDETNEPFETIGLDAGWIASQVVVEGVAAARAEFAGFIGTGQMSRNARFRLAWPSGSDGPDSVVVKLPSADPGTRGVSFDHDLYLKECEFYSRIAPLVDVAVPKAWAVHFDPEGKDFAIVLEDLVDSVGGDQFSDPDDDQVVAAIEQAAALHAPVWGRTDEPAFSALHEDAAERAARGQSILPLVLPLVQERLGQGLDPDVAELLVTFTDRIGDWSLMRAEPTTLVHGDYRPDNFLLAATADAPALVVVDWQTLGLGAGVTDISYLLGGALDPERRRAAEPELLERYRAELAARGVDYPADRCQHEYSLGSLHGVVVAMTATALAERTERGDALFTLMLNRHGRHALDLDTMGLIG